MSSTPSAVVLLSGGLDSTTVLAQAAAQGRIIHALSFDYGQRHGIELECARRQAQRHGVRAHEIVQLEGLARLVRGATALLAGGPAVPTAQGAQPGAIPVTYVPARNIVFLTYALAWAEALGAQELWLGVNAVDYSGYPDCRPEFLNAFEAMVAVGTKAGVEGSAPRIVAPIIDMAKHEIIATGTELGVDYADTISCYDPSGSEGKAYACGRCESCVLRRAGFEASGVADPTLYTRE